MKDNEILNQAAEIMAKTEALVEHAHKLLRANDINQPQFVDIKKLELKAQQVYRRLQDESR